MKHVDCTEYPVVGWLIGRTLAAEKAIHRTTLAVTPHGRITIYYHQETFILECDTIGAHAPNDYYFFRDAERSEIDIVIAKMDSVIGVAGNIDVDRAVGLAMEYIKAR